jgi:hypothetical protein
MASPNIAFLAYLLPVPILVGWAVIKFYTAKRQKGITYPVPIGATVLYVALYLLFYFLTAVLIVLFGIPVEAIVGEVALNGQTLTGISPTILPPIGASVLVIWISSKDFWHHPNDQLLDQLLAVGHLKDDRDALYDKLVNGPFTPSPAEANKNAETLHKYGVFLSSKPTLVDGLQNSNIVEMWRKVSCLIRFAEKIKCDNYVPSVEDLPKVADIKKKHKNRTELALHIVRLEHTARIARVPDKARAEGMTESGDEAANANPDSILLSPEELASSISKIEGFLVVQYTGLLRSIARLVSYGVAYSGHSAAERVGMLVERGFPNLGTLRTLTADLLAQLLFRVFVATSAIFILYSFARLQGLVPGIATPITKPEELHKLIAIVCQTALSYVGATLCGSLVASSRRLRRRDEAPFAWYLAGSFGAVVVYLGLAALFLVASNLFDPPQDVSAGPLLPAIKERWRDVLGWMPLPFAAAFGVPYAAWHPNNKKTPPWWKERALDASILAPIVAAGAFFSIFLHFSLPTSFGSATLNHEGTLNAPFALSFLVLASIIGGTIGAISAAPCRRIAQSEL